MAEYFCQRISAAEALLTFQRQARPLDRQRGDARLARKQIDGTAAAPVVELTQTFKQGRFADEGQKRLVLTRTPAGLRIAREEMVRSVVGSLPATAGGDLWLAFTLEKKPHVLIADTVSDSWGQGPVRGPFEQGFYYATRDASE